MKQIETFEGSMSGKEMTIAIVASRFNELIVSHLIEGAVDCMKQHEVRKVNIYRCPGAYEIPLVAKKILSSKKPPDGVVTLGALIRGSTIHFDLIAKDVSAHLLGLSMETGIPIGFGVLTTETIEQAFERAGGKAGNKGRETAMAVIEMIQLSKII